MGCSEPVLLKLVSLIKLQNVLVEISQCTKKQQVLLSKTASSGAFGTKAPVLFAYYCCCFLFCIYIHKGMSSATSFIVITETRAMISVCTLSLLFAATFLAAPLVNQGEKMEVGWASVMFTSLCQPSLSTNSLKISYVFCSSSDNFSSELWSSPGRKELVGSSGEVKGQGIKSDFVFSSWYLVIERHYLNTVFSQLWLTFLPSLICIHWSYVYRN